MAIYVWWVGNRAPRRVASGNWKRPIDACTKAEREKRVLIDRSGTNVMTSLGLLDIEGNMVKCSGTFQRKSRMKSGLRVWRYKLS